MEQKNLLAKWNVTPDELTEAVDELCEKGIGKGCFQKTDALLAVLDLLTNGDIPDKGKGENA